MIDGLQELHEESFRTIAFPFVWNGKTVYLKREEDFEVENSNQNVFRGLKSEIGNIKNGDVLSCPYYKDNKELKVISARHFGDDANFILIACDDVEELSVQ